MCDQCDKLKEKIVHHRLFLNQRFDALTEERIKALIADLERQKEAMHSLEGTRNDISARRNQADGGRTG
jgi:hypothetical protein